MREKFIPIGSVVMLEGGNKKIMVTGYCVGHGSDKAKLHDYSGCLYPEGIITSDRVILFDHNQIKEIYYTGYEDEGWDKLKKVLQTLHLDVSKKIDEKSEVK